MAAAEVAVERPVLGQAAREAERVLARAVVPDPRPPRAARRARVERQLRPAAEGRLDQPARREHLGDALDVRLRPAVRRARQRQVALAQAEALEHAGAHATQRLERLDRRAREHRQLRVGPGDGPVREHGAPGDAVLGLHRTAPQGDHARQERFSRRRSRLSWMIRSAASPSTTSLREPLGISTRQYRGSSMAAER
jgi:hypothetical protein